MRANTLRELTPPVRVALAAFWLVVLPLLAGAGRPGAAAGAGMPGCDSVGMSTTPAASAIAADPNAAGCLLAETEGLGPIPDGLRARRPVRPLDPVPTPGYHHVGTWNSDVARERATVHSSKLAGVRTRAGECFWRTSHLVAWETDRGRWVESGLFKCGAGPYKIFVYVGWGEGEPGYVIPEFDVPEGALVTTFAEWECINNETVVSGGYFNDSGQKVYLVRYHTGRSPCVSTNQTDNNGEAYTVPGGRSAHFNVEEYAALNTRICSKDGAPAGGPAPSGTPASTPPRWSSWTRTTCTGSRTARATRPTTTTGTGMGTSRRAQAARSPNGREPAS